MSKDATGRFAYSPVSVNFLTECAKCMFAVLLLVYQDHNRQPGERALLTYNSLNRAARTNLLLMVPALLYAINNYLKFAMQLFFKPATVKMLGNLKARVCLFAASAMPLPLGHLWRAVCMYSHTRHAHPPTRGWSILCCGQEQMGREWRRVSSSLQGWSAIG